MKPVDHQLDRLFKAAAGAPGRPADALSAAMEQRILGRWRAERSGAGDWSELVAVFRRGLAFASLVAAVAVAASIQSAPRDDVDEFANTETGFELALK